MVDITVSSSYGIDTKYDGELYGGYTFISETEKE
jgi:hypothetical protein